MSEVLFQWNPQTRVVYGASRAAIYDFHTGRVYSLNPVARRIVEQMDRGQPIHIRDMDRGFLFGQLTELGLGQLTSQPMLEHEENDSEAAQPTASLRFLWLELTTSCNLHCVHCYLDGDRSKQSTSAGSLGVSPGMQVEDWKRMLREGAELGCREVQFTGGEPLLYPGLFSLIDDAQTYSYSSIEVFTNGTLVTDQIASTLAEWGVHVAVSLHSSRLDVQDQVTRTEGSFERVYAGLRTLQKHRVPVRLATTALKTNQHDLPSLASLSEEMGLPNHSNSLVRAIDQGKMAELMPDDPAVIASYLMQQPDFSTSQESYFRHKRWHPCWAGKLAITSRGDVIPCVFARDQIVGHVHHQSLEEILRGEALKAMWGLTKDCVEVCWDCEYRYACGDCRPLALSQIGDLYGKYPLCTYDPFSGEWGTIDDRSGNITELDSNERPNVVLVTKGAISWQHDYHARYQCTPDRSYHSRYRCDPDRSCHARYRCDPDG